MHRNFRCLFAFVVAAWRRPPHAQETAHRVRRRLDEERPRRHQRRLHQGDRHQGDGELRRELGAGQADRSRRAGRRVRLGRSRMDGLRRASKKLIKDDTRVNLLGNKLVLIAPKDSKTRQRHDRPGLRHRQARRRRPHRRRPTCARCRPANTPRRRWRSSAPGPRRSRSSRTAENVRAALALVGRGEAPLGIVYETDAKVEPNVKIVGAFPGRLASADHLSGGADGECEAGGGAVSRLPALGSARRRSSRHTASRS